MCRTCNMQWRKRACSLHWCSWMLAICIICNGFGIEFKHSDNTQKLAFNLCALGVEDLWSIANIYTAYPVLMVFLYQYIVHGNISGEKWKRKLNEIIFEMISVFSIHKWSILKFRIQIFMWFYIVECNTTNLSFKSIPTNERWGVKQRP